MVIRIPQILQTKMMQYQKQQQKLNLKRGRQNKVNVKDTSVDENKGDNETSVPANEIENVKGTSEGASVEKLSNNVDEDENARKDNNEENSEKRVLGDITNTVIDDSSKHKELEGTFVMNAENNNDAKTPDAERKKKQTKEKQTRRRTFVIEESPTNATGAIDCIEEGALSCKSCG